MKRWSMRVFLLAVGFGLAPVWGEETLAVKVPVADGAGAVTRERWDGEKREAVREQWLELLGDEPALKYECGVEVIERFDRPGWRGTLMRQSTGERTRQLVLLMEPKGKVEGKRPGVVVPFYHPDASAGFDLKTREEIRENREIQFGRHLVEQGYVVLCTEAFPYNLVPEPADARGLNWWAVAAEALGEQHPEWSGLGKLVYDTRRAIDLLLEQPAVDRDRVVLMGHSLGGKMAFWTGCLDERVAVTVASDFGIGWDSTNWSDAWYLGDRITGEGFELEPGELLSLHAPRAFLLIAGQYDGAGSLKHLERAAPVFRLYEDGVGRLGVIDHASGHRPTEEALRLGYEWLAEVLGVPLRDWSF